MYCYQLNDQFTYVLIINTYINFDRFKINSLKRTNKIPLTKTVDVPVGELPSSAEKFILRMNVNAGLQ